MAYVRDARSSLDGPALPSSEITALAVLASRGDDRACTEVVRALYPRIRNFASEVCARFSCAWLADDVVGAGIEATLSAFSTWKVSGLPFLVYALERARWQMVKEVRALAYPTDMPDKSRLRDPRYCFVPDSEIAEIGVFTHDALVWAVDLEELLGIFEGRELACLRRVLVPMGAEYPVSLQNYWKKRRVPCLDRCRRHARVYRPWRVTERKHEYRSR